MGLKFSLWPCFEVERGKAKQCLTLRKRTPRFVVQIETNDVFIVETEKLLTYLVGQDQGEFGH